MGIHIIENPHIDIIKGIINQNEMIVAMNAVLIRVLANPKIQTTEDNVCQSTK